ncbi:MAG: DinB family protein [Anaerolineales bacterium]|nr:DinB family protein [Anaerolineales bacterium]MCB9110268.1 DinB family protein [Anaerolineales bacterium]
MSESTELAEKLKTEGERMSAFFAGIMDDQWDCEVYTEGTIWSIRNVLAHYVTSERGLIKLFERIRTSGEGVSEDFSIDRYNASQQEKTRDLAPAELLEQYKQVRAESVAWTAGLKDEELDIQGRHPFLGETVIREMVKMLYIHNQLHYRDVKRALK